MSGWWRPRRQRRAERRAGAVEAITAAMNSSQGGAADFVEFVLQHWNAAAEF